MAYPTGPGHGVVGAYQHQPAPPYGGYPPPPAPAYGSGYTYPPPPAYGGGYTYPPPPAYGGGYPPAPAYCGGYPAFVPAPYGPYIPYTAPAAQPKSPIISGIVTAAIEALAIGVFRGAVTNTLFDDAN
ncbi:uncharacterized protein LOC111984957 [Quercus suber]|uniref:uncharacterized protein LOC111984957 n=1 Tax=Quercus suber TaxID=58331 RepID=UPI000CE19671|nr:uncharacterized protein LOC111984957 [Quercus suber]XP_023880211.1 uncharacterized protein LOC111992564 [Quercus suber]POE75992.1 hypothetical protein CFP56_53511 [Quercus suber]POE85966.1 hypothetical protein CFP56_30462 [Quercus suber]